MSRLNRVLLACGVAVVAVSVSVTAQAQPAQAQTVKDPKKLPKTGSLSSTVKSDSAAVEVPDVYGGVDPSGEKVPPVSGSFSRVDNDTFRVVVTNNAADKISVSVDAIQKDVDGKKMKSDSFTFTLQPKQSAQRDVVGSEDTVDTALIVRNIKSYAKPTPKATGTPALDMRKNP